MNSRGGDGAETIYALRNDNVLPNLILDEIAKEGQNIRKSFQRRLPSNTSKDYYFMHRNTGNTHPVIVEYGFLDSKADDVSQLKNNYEDYAEAVVRAVSEYIDLSYIPTEGSNYYTVKSGDSLWSIAKKFGVSVDELKTANNLTSNLLSLGQILRIPTKQEESGDYITYTVKKGDTLYSIARNYNLSVSDIVNLNNLKTNLLTLGQQLLLPVEQKAIQTEYDTYTVKSGDTLYSIAQRYNISVDNLRKINDLTTSTLQLGQKLLVPKSTQIIDQGTSETGSNYTNYVVKSGDNLYSIANKYGVSVSELMQVNNLKSNLLTIGQVLKIPQLSQITYTVKAGDNLYSIANAYNTTVDSIKRKNNLTSNTLRIGQQLII
ncbi:MAG: LysM peptidoglycan-binding domain-containing protein [Clostridium sp.]|nr:LysM peptidoglycan-binding domain-containing protein [Clostridium sp.]MCM1443718.1 LysM peptidoglycan-binding domain-containing protein [Candidatus Amulumruptor caecigallinarius]